MSNRAGTPRSICPTYDRLGSDHAIRDRTARGRGGHFREDYPDKDAAFATFNIITRKASDGGMEVARALIPPMPEELTKVIER